MAVLSYVGGDVRLPAGTAERILRYALALSRRREMDAITIATPEGPSGSVSLLIGSGVALATHAAGEPDVDPGPSELDRDLDRRMRDLDSGATPLLPEEQVEFDWIDLL